MIRGSSVIGLIMLLTGCAESQRVGEYDSYVPVACDTHPKQPACRNSLNDKLIDEKKQ